MFTHRSMLFRMTFKQFFYANTMDLRVVPGIGGFQLGKLVSILSNKNKQVEVTECSLTSP